ncbi:hypothetical protein OG909_32215 [Streptomyces sp. NBC_01754]|uniref:hypothetical protein n=1 Tax=Streptomyces sp. NBC_01754 TaxID=2975930 RepID=UPI002DDA2651|nr:hypothetical protein [Streptomyces sp. NBC_01754]WSC90900.1 hypothetical protein OG909_00490 [Streptomyces sp. NBC_01754]WSC96606.1 hypothetical protein OG909_32215 [Streptomyces sp. NBC_01754]
MRRQTGLAVHGQERVPENDEHTSPPPRRAGHKDPPQTARPPTPSSSPLTPRSLHRLQQGAGNAAVSRLLAARRPPPRAPDPGPHPAGPAATGNLPDQGPDPRQPDTTEPLTPRHTAAPGSPGPPPDGEGHPARPSIHRAPAARPARQGPPPDAGLVPDRLPDGAAAVAATTAATGQGELDRARAGAQPVATSLLKRQPTAAPRQQPTTERPPDAPGQQPAPPVQDQEEDGTGPHGDTTPGFTPVDVAPLLPPLWGQTPDEHEEEIADHRQTLADDRATGAGRLDDFTVARRSASSRLDALAQQLTAGVHTARAGALDRITAAETSALATLRGAVDEARAAVRGRAGSARGEVTAAHAATVSATTSATGGARTAMSGVHRDAGTSVGTKENQEITDLGALYTRTEGRMRDAAAEAGRLAVVEGNRRAEQYRAGMIHRDDSWLDGPLTDNRRRAQADASVAVGEAYRDELPSAVDEPIGDMRKGRPDAEKAVRTVAADVRESLATVLAQCRQNLAGAHQQSLRGAGDAQQGGLGAIDQAVSAAEGSLSALLAGQTEAIRGQAAQQRKAAEQGAARAVVAISTGAATARRGLDRGLTEFLGVLRQDEVPDPGQLDEVLGETGEQLDDQLESLAQGLRDQAGQATASLTELAAGAARALTEIAGSAAASARQTSTGTTASLTGTASRTAGGLRQLQEGHARLAKETAAGHAEAGQQVLDGLDEACTSLGQQFAEGADGQVAAVREGLGKAATEDIHPTIDEEAKKAYDRVEPRWKSVLVVLVVIVVVVALSIALGPLVIGAVTAGAAALGAGAAAATIGVIVGGAVVGAVAGAVGQVVSNALNGQPLLDGVVKAAVFGAIGGAVGGGVSAAVARTALGTAARVGIEMSVEAVVEVGMTAIDSAITGQKFTWQDALLSVVTTVAVTGVMAHPRVEAMTARVQQGATSGLAKLGIKVPPASADAPRPDAVDTPAVEAVPSPSTGKPPGSGSGSGSVSGSGDGVPQPGRGPDGVTSWDASTIDPTGGAGSANSPVRPPDEAGMAAELRTALGPLGRRVELEIDSSLPGRTVRVHYDIGPDGLLTDIRVAAGPSATPTDIRLHVPTARTMLRYNGLSGRVRRLLDQIREWIGLHGPPPVGTRAWEAHLEVRKLPRIIEDRVRALTDADPAARAELEAELHSLQQQFDLHTAALKEWSLDPGRGYVAAERKELMDAIKKLPDDVVVKLREHDQFRHFQLTADGRTLLCFRKDQPEVYKRWDITRTPPKELGPGERKPPERFPDDTDPADALRILREESLGFGGYVQALLDLKVINAAEDLIPLVPDKPAGMKHDTVRHNIKVEYNQKIVDAIESHQQFLEISKLLESKDKGNLGERWYKKKYLESSGSPLEEITISQDDFPALSGKRRIDFYDDHVIHEVKNIARADRGELESQFNDYLAMVDNDVPGLPDKPEELRVAFLNPEGLLSNAYWLKKLREHWEDKLRILAFDSSGNQFSEVVTADMLDLKSEAGRELRRFLTGRTGESSQSSGTEPAHGEGEDL